MKYVDIKKRFTSYDQQIRHLDKDGNLIDKNYKMTFTKEKLKEAYSYMVLSRQQDTYMSQLQRQGRMLTFAPNFGEEALQVASSSATIKGDWFVPAFRSNASMLQMGVPILNQMLYWNGSEKGSKMPEGVNVLPINIPIATQCSHAIGLAYGMKMSGDKNVAITFIGNGGTAEGEFYEAMNIAAIHNLPVVFCINNNQWSISTPEKYESVSRTLALKSESVGIPGVLVDGNDLLASYDVIKEATEFARAGNGPVLVEFLSWRQGVHTSSDNPRIYRTEKQEKDAEVWEPFHRIEKFMIDKKIMSKQEIDKLKADQLNVVKDTYQESLKHIEGNIDDVFDHTYEKLTPELVEQKAQVKEFFGGDK